MTHTGKIRNLLFCRTLLLRAFIAGKARWELFSGSIDSGEVCVGGMRYTTKLDETGCPVVHELMAAALYKAVGGFPSS